MFLRTMCWKLLTNTKESYRGSWHGSKCSGLRLWVGRQKLGSWPETSSLGRLQSKELMLPSAGYGEDGPVPSLFIGAGNGRLGGLGTCHSLFSLEVRKLTKRSHSQSVLWSGARKQVQHSCRAWCLLLWIQIQLWSFPSSSSSSSDQSLGKSLHFQ